MILAPFKPASAISLLVLAIVALRSSQMGSAWVTATLTVLGASSVEPMFENCEDGRW